MFKVIYRNDQLNKIIWSLYSEHLKENKTKYNAWGTLDCFFEDFIKFLNNKLKLCQFDIFYSPKLAL